MHNVSDIHLSFKENRSLIKYFNLGESKLLPNSRRLLSNKLIEPVFVVRSAGDMPIPNGLYSVTELGVNYIQYRKEKMFLNKIPVIISIIALIKSFSDDIIRIVILLRKLLEQ